jgi:hypothetical protein
LDLPFYHVLMKAFGIVTAAVLVVIGIGVGLVGGNGSKLGPVGQAAGWGPVVG